MKLKLVFLIIFSSITCAHAASVLRYNQGKIWVRDCQTWDIEKAEDCQTSSERSIGKYMDVSVVLNQMLDEYKIKLQQELASSIDLKANLKLKEKIRLITEKKQSAFSILNKLKDGELLVFNSMENQDEFANLPMHFLTRKLEQRIAVYIHSGDDAGVGLNKEVGRCSITCHLDENEKAQVESVCMISKNGKTNAVKDITHEKCFIKAAKTYKCLVDPEEEKVVLTTLTTNPLFPSGVNSYLTTPVFDANKGKGKTPNTSGSGQYFKSGTATGHE